MCKQNLTIYCNFNTFGYFICQNEAENIPFPNDENEFNLPDEIFEPPGQAGSDYNDDGQYNGCMTVFNESTNHEVIIPCSTQ